MYILLLALLFVGLYGLFAKRNLIKKILGVAIADHALNLFLIQLAYRRGGSPPILAHGADREEFARTAVDPVPQALVLTSIVIGLGILMLMVALALRIRQRCGTMDATRIRNLRG